MSKESIAKKRAQKLAKANPQPQKAAAPAAQPVKPLPKGSFIQSPVRRINKRFIIMFALWVVALGLSLYFITRVR